MMGVCGLALSSLFIVSNESVVHADSVSNAQNNAITWDSDDDDSQVVKNEQQQNNVIQSVQTQGSAQRKQVETSNISLASQSVQVGVQSQTEKGVAYVSSADNQRTQTKVANVNATIQNTPVQIINPHNNQVVVHYVNMNDQAVAGVQDTTIDVTKLGRGQYTVPSGYQLANNGGYTADDNMSTSQVQGYYYGKAADGEPDPNKLTKAGNPLTGSVAYKLAHNFRATDSGDAAVDFDNGDGTYTHASSEIYLNIYPYDNEYRPDCDWIVDVESLMGDYYLYSHRVNNNNGKKPITAKDVYYIPHDPTDTYERVLTPQEGAELLNWANNVFGSSMATSADGITYVGDPASDRDSPHFILKMRGHELAYRFTDNSGQVKAVNGNTIDLAVTKPQSVDPATNSRLNAEATRTIKINFPGSIPPSYKNIVDDKGVLTQTVKFTRTGQEDMLTGNLIESSIGPWQSNNSDPNFLGFPERTLPRIPGYTLSIKPV